MRACRTGGALRVGACVRGCSKKAVSTPACPPLPRVPACPPWRGSRHASLRRATCRAARLWARGGGGAGRRQGGGGAGAAVLDGHAGSGLRCARGCVAVCAAAALRVAVRAPGGVAPRCPLRLSVITLPLLPPAGAPCPFFRATFGAVDEDLMAEGFRRLGQALVAARKSALLGVCGGGTD